MSINLSSVVYLGIGYSQNWYNVTSSRSVSTTYYNTTGRVLGLSILITDATTFEGNLYVNGEQVQWVKSDAASDTLFGIVPPGQSYRVTFVGTPTIPVWNELY